MPSRIRRLTDKIVWHGLCLTALLVAFPLQARPFHERLNALGAAVDAYQANQQGTPEAPEWRKLMWLHLAGDKLPDALVVLRNRRDDCASVANGPQPCRALMMVEQEDGSFRVVTEFTLRVQPVALLRAPDGIRDLFYTRDGGATPSYVRYRFDGQAFQRVEGDIAAAQLQALPLLVADDRNMALWADQTYAARQFPNDAARLAPFRLHFDGVTVSEVRARGYNPGASWYDKDFEERARGLAEALLPDAQTLTRALPWPQTLELRLWSCVDWVVERRFWEVEDRRLGRPGACVEPAVFSLTRGVVKPGGPQLDLVRTALLQQVGLAYVLRIAPWTPAQRAQLRQGNDAAEARFIGAAAGLLLGQLRQIMTLDRAAEALAVLEAMADKWFNEIERGRLRFVTPTPELRDFAAGLAAQTAALRCVRQALGQPVPKAAGKAGCDASRLEATRRLAAQLQEDMKP